ncbi:unnamed protein product [Protopolystoma xenopodis]|uniref:Uncharacterized protein n=1 Tax=Protopolystoma xenopodis TaxID=117903 RepID=A0A3S5A7B8_9PLAT|nr:unnamed protein product [Protopolystoma xenopodis]
MARLTDDADETSEIVPSSWSDACTYDNYYGTGLETMCVQPSRENKAKPLPTSYVLSSPPMSPKSMLLQVGLMKHNHLYDLYQMPFAGLF